MKKNMNGITLISLVITIIVLLILAGVALDLTIGDNGIFTRAQESTQIYQEEEAREKLELALGSILMDKYKDVTYNENEYIDNRLKEQGMAVDGDTVTVGTWQFEIDRTTLSIKENQDIEIIANSETTADSTKAILNVQIKSKKTIRAITIGGESVDVPVAENGVYTIQKEVTQNGDYNIEVQDEEGNYIQKTIKVEGIIGIYEESAAREKLELALNSILMDKYMDPTYNENEYIDNRLKEQGMTVEGDIVTVDGWQFEINRGNLTIK